MTRAEWLAAVTAALDSMSTSITSIRQLLLNIPPPTTTLSVVGAGTGKSSGLAVTVRAPNVNYLAVNATDYLCTEKLEQIIV